LDHGKSLFIAFDENCVCCGNPYGFEYDAEFGYWLMTCNNQAHHNPIPCKRNCKTNCPLDVDHEKYHNLVMDHCLLIDPILWSHLITHQRLQLGIPITRVAGKYEEIKIWVNDFMHTLATKDQWIDTIRLMVSLRLAELGKEKNPVLMIVIEPFDDAKGKLLRKAVVSHSKKPTTVKQDTGFYFCYRDTTSNIPFDIEKEILEFQKLSEDAPQETQKTD
jgi:hypothetical protein